MRAVALCVIAMQTCGQRRPFKDWLRSRPLWGSNERSRHDRPVAWKLVITLFYTCLFYRAVQYHAYACVAGAAIGGTLDSPPASTEYETNSRLPSPLPASGYSLSYMSIHPSQLSCGLRSAASLSP